MGGGLARVKDYPTVVRVDLRAFGRDSPGLVQVPVAPPRVGVSERPLAKDVADIAARRSPVVGVQRLAAQEPALATGWNRAGAEWVSLVMTIRATWTDLTLAKNNDTEVVVASYCPHLARSR